jgi:nitrate reductase gamma subunit
MGWLIVVATYAVIAAFYVRLALHALTWWEAVRRSPGTTSAAGAGRVRAIVGSIGDIVLLRRLVVANPALWLGEWGFHAALILVILRHLRYFVNPVPAWVICVQTPGWIAGFLLPAALGYILVIRLLTRREQYSSPVNLLLLADVFAIGVSGLLMSTRYRVDVAAVKIFAIGIVSFRPSPPPLTPLFVVHLALVLALVLYVPSHVFTAPLVLLDARGRENELRRVLHDP